MNQIFALPSNGRKADWVMFAAMVLAIGLAVGIVAVWYSVYRPKKKKVKRKQHRRKRHHRQHNPTLAETGGLPPMRDPNQPPPGL